MQWNFIEHTEDDIHIVIIPGIQYILHINSEDSFTACESRDVNTNNIRVHDIARIMIQYPNKIILI